MDFIDSRGLMIALLFKLNLEVLLKSRSPLLTVRPIAWDSGFAFTRSWGDWNTPRIEEQESSTFFNLGVRLDFWNSDWSECFDWVLIFLYESRPLLLELDSPHSLLNFCVGGRYLLKEALILFYKRMEGCLGEYSPTLATFGSRVRSDFFEF